MGEIASTDQITAPHHCRISCASKCSDHHILKCVKIELRRQKTSIIGFFRHAKSKCLYSEVTFENKIVDFKDFLFQEFKSTQY